MDIVALREAINGMEITELLLWLIIFVLAYSGVLNIPKLVKKIKSKVLGIEGATSSNPHANCTNEYNMQMTIEKTAVLTDLIRKIEREDTPYAQMNVMEQMLMGLKTKLSKIYFTMFKEENNGEIDGIMDAKDVKHYEEILDNCESYVKKLILKWIKENHFLEKTEEEFNLYVTEKIESIFTEVTEFINIHYPTAIFNISREKLYNTNIEKITEYSNTAIRNSFYRVREISREKKEEVRELQESAGIYTKEGDK